MPRMGALTTTDRSETAVVWEADRTRPCLWQMVGGRCGTVKFPNSSGNKTELKGRRWCEKTEIGVGRYNITTETKKHSECSSGPG